MKVFLTAGKEWRAPHPTTSLSQPSRSPSPPHHTYGEIHSPHTTEPLTVPNKPSENDLSIREGAERRTIPNLQCNDLQFLLFRDILISIILSDIHFQNISNLNIHLKIYRRH